MLQILLLLGSAAALLAWAAMPHRGHILKPIVLGVALLGWLGCAWSWWRRPPLQGRLRWDGQDWWLRLQSDPADSGPCARLVVTIDLGRWMLLRLRTQASTLPHARATTWWLPMSAAALGDAWHPLRCAVYSPRPAAPLPVPDDPAAPASHDR
ncbi:hypothetical protein [Sphaerotilus hippei]|uniref:hypothetical protein n=1 Tax=Sphaerotilus hippei TaxID=744406 RepID=UPI0014742B36|nr:hypothetical protein [Sphaerotilus hippei]